MGIAPVATLFQAQVFVADIVATDPGGLSVHHHILAMVAKIELEAIAPALGGAERGDVHAGHLQLAAEAGLAEFVAADLVVQQEYLEPGARLVRQYPAQPPAEVIVADNVELEQDVVFRAGEAGQDAVEGLPAVDQQFHAIAGGGAHARQVVQAGIQRGITGERHDVLLDQAAGFAVQAL